MHPGGPSEEEGVLPCINACMSCTQPRCLWQSSTVQCALNQMPATAPHATGGSKFLLVFLPPGV